MKKVNPVFDNSVRNQIQTQDGLIHAFIDWQTKVRDYSYSAGPHGSFPDSLSAIVQEWFATYESVFLGDKYWRDLDPNHAPPEWRTKTREFTELQKKKEDAVFQDAEGRLDFEEVDSLQHHQTALKLFADLLSEYDSTYFEFRDEMDAQVVRARRQIDLARTLYSFKPELACRYAAMLGNIPETEPALERGQPYSQEIARLSSSTAAPSSAMPKELEAKLDVLVAAQQSSTTELKAHIDNAAAPIATAAQQTAESIARVEPQIIRTAKVSKILEQKLDSVLHSLPKLPSRVLRSIKNTMKNKVIFSDDFKTVNCSAWKKSESRGRIRQATDIIRRLYENWRDNDNTPISAQCLLEAVDTDRLEKILNPEKQYPLMWSLICQRVNEKTGIREVWLSEDYTYCAS
jgi:hypothetical protein